MDPNATLQEIRELIAAHLRGDEIDVDELVTYTEALDTWISRGGFLPSAWKQ